MTQQTNNNSGMGVFFGIVLAIAVIVGAYFYIQNHSADNGALEPAAGTESLTNGDTDGPSDTAPQR
ncbi:MAG TPA: hypothetical protein VFS88_06585 [Micavibrio sp.]|nr:hypothetical protein [Micavibrio sp.]